eukprot:1922317-Prorocentrum_lima.AAC.1
MPPRPWARVSAHDAPATQATNKAPSRKNTTRGNAGAPCQRHLRSAHRRRRPTTGERPEPHLNVDPVLGAYER